MIGSTTICHQSGYVYYDKSTLIAPRGGNIFVYNCVLKQFLDERGDQAVEHNYDIQYNLKS